MIIDKKNPDHAEFPDSLDGEVLLERTLDKYGNVDGFITTTIDQVYKVKLMTDSEMLTNGWDKYQTVLDSIDTKAINLEKRL